MEGTERQQADCLNNAGVAFNVLGGHNEALDAYEVALDFYRDLPDTERQQADCLNCIGTALRRTESDKNYQDRKSVV